MLVQHIFKGVDVFGVYDIIRQVVPHLLPSGNRRSLSVILSCHPLALTDGVGSHDFYLYDFEAGMTLLWYPYHRCGNACTSQSYLHVLFDTLRLGGRVFLVCRNIRDRLIHRRV